MSVTRRYPLLRQAPFLSSTVIERANGILIYNYGSNPGDPQRYYSGTGPYDAAIAAAILQANLPGGAPLNFNGAILPVVNNVANLHTTPKIGTGAITRGGNTFYLNLASGATNTLFRATTGNDANDGIDAAHPFLTLQAQLDAAYKNYGPTIPGTWKFKVAGGSYTDAAVMQPYYQSANPIQILGPDNGGVLPFVPTWIQEGGGTQPFWLVGNGYNNVVVENVQWQNYRSGGGATGINFQTFGQLELINCYGANNDQDFKTQQVRTTVIGGVFYGGSMGCTLISSGETHTIGNGIPGSTTAIPGNIVITGVSGTGTQVTFTFAAQPSAPIVNGWTAITGYTGAAAGYNGLYQVVSSTLTTIVINNTTTAASAGTPVIAYNGGCSGYGPMFYGKSVYGALAQENATGHLDNAALISCVDGVQVLVSSRFNANYTLFQGNSDAAALLEEAGDLNDNNCNFGTSNRTTKDCRGPSGEIGRMGKWTMIRRLPPDTATVTNTGVFALATVKTYAGVIDAAGFTIPSKQFSLTIVGNSTGGVGTKTLTVNLDGAQVASFTTGAVAGNYIFQCRCNALTATTQFFDANFVQNGQASLVTQGPLSITLTAGTITIQEAIAGAGDTLVINKVDIFSEGGA